MTIHTTAINLHCFCLFHSCAMSEPNTNTKQNQHNFLPTLQRYKEIRNVIRMPNQPRSWSSLWKSSELRQVLLDRRQKTIICSNIGMGHVQIPTVERVGICRFIVMKRLCKTRLTFGIFHQNLSHVLGTRFQLRVKVKIRLSKGSLRCRIG